MKNRSGGILWGVVLIALGVIFIGNISGLWDFSLFFAGWWTLFILVPCLIGLIQHGPNVGNCGGLLVGALLLAAAQGWLSWQMMGKLILPLLLIVAGLALIFQNMFNRQARVVRSRHQGEMREYCAIFSGQKELYAQEEFKGADLTAVFGGIELDLRAAIIQEDVTIQATSIFGGCDVWVPAGVKVKLSNTPIFGGAENKTNTVPAPDAPTIYINGFTLFGGLEVK
ncbi:MULTISPECIES: LiaF domain-containing protein [unclassified Clostridium]|uniref:LiaF transmembrane domain-containing protein n=1 Tax=unclassified Clostridium TaxID=2614128 RepID=UPI0008206B41|nr:MULTISPECIES: LiaF domain-containing protein [unclassified Clostridium]SCJ45519.1 Predicted membrane protein [uncultured Clostridium sp.]